MKVGSNRMGAEPTYTSSDCNAVIKPHRHAKYRISHNSLDATATNRIPLSKGRIRQSINQSGVQFETLFRSRVRRKSGLRLHLRGQAQLEPLQARILIGFRLLHCGVSDSAPSVRHLLSYKPP